MSATVLVNGVPAATVDALDRGLQYADGLFETLAVLDGRTRLLDLHLERLDAGCRRLGLQAPPAELLAREVASVAPAPRAVVKVIVTRGPAGRGYRPPAAPAQTRIVTGYPYPAYPSSWLASGVQARTCRTRLGDSTVLAGLKHLGRLEQVLARAEWQDESIAEGLMLDARDHVACGTQSNLFLVACDRLLTPPVDRCGVAGVMRQAVFEWSRGGQRAAIEADIRPGDLFDADEVFVTNAVIGAWRLAALDGRRLGETGCAREFMAWLETR